MGVVTRYLKLYLILMIIINLIGFSKSEVGFCGDDDYIIPCVINVSQLR